MVLEDVEVVEHQACKTPQTRDAEGGRAVLNVNELHQNGHEAEDEGCVRVYIHVRIVIRAWAFVRVCLWVYVLYGMIDNV